MGSTVRVVTHCMQNANRSRQLAQGEVKVRNSGMQRGYGGWLALFGFTGGPATSRFSQ